jgi:hypothetical protein
MKLYFEDRFGREREVAEIAYIEEAFVEIKAFLDNYNYKSYYIRHWTENGVTTFDVGSHSEFFHLKEK